MPTTQRWTAPGRPQRPGPAPAPAAARRKLWLSLPALVLASAVWMLWSAVVVQLPAAGFRYSSNQLFWLTALPGLSGATLRVFHAFAVPLVGGRRFTALATASLLLPAVGMGLALRDPSTSYVWMLVLALLCGLGGANVAGMRQLGHLGLLGIPLVQLVVPLVVAVVVPLAAPSGGGSGPWLQNAGFVWVPLIAASALAAWFGLDDRAEARASVAEQAVVFTRRHNWLMCWLHAGGFGSFIGFSAGLPLLLHGQFGGPGHAGAVHLAWAGPLLGVLAWPLGGWLAGRLGGGRVSLWAFTALAAGVLLLVPCLPGFTSATGQEGSLPGVLALFALLFTAAGVAGGSTTCMVPAIFLAQHLQAAGPLPAAQAQARRQGGMEAAAVLGFAGALGAYGGFFIPKGWGSAIALTGSPAPALPVFFVFYLSCIALTWWHYARRQAPMPC